MRRLLVLTLLTFSSSIFAQEAIKYANRSIGGGLAFKAAESTNPGNFYFYNPDYYYTYYSSENEISSFSFSPYYGRFILDKHMLGIRFNIRSENQSSADNEQPYLDEMTQSAKSLSFGAFLKRFFPINEKVGIYVQPGANYSSERRNIEFTRFDTISVTNIRHHKELVKRQEISIDMRIGVYYFFTEKFSIETSLGSSGMALSKSRYQMRDLIEKTLTKESASSSSINFSLINQFSFDQLFTINYYF